MQKRVQRKEANIVITTSSKASPVSGSGKAPNHGVDFLPDVDELAQRYGVSYIDEEGEGEEGEDEDSLTDAHKGRESVKSTQREEELARLAHTLKDKLDAKNRQIEQLCVLLEALEPIPGVQPRRLQGLVSAGGSGKDEDDPTVDLRDAKIVSLAKKAHHLTMLVNKERAKAEKASRELNDAQRELVSLRRENEQQKTLLSAASSKSEKVYNRHTMQEQSVREEEEESKAQTQRALRESTKERDELKEKLKRAQEENKKLTKALERELGDGVSLEQAVDGGWRGRAQQIVMLKAKIKQLEAGQGRTTYTQSRNDVDTKAEEELSEMSKERRLIVEQLTQERQRLIESNEALEKKASAQKARIHILESDMRRMKENMQVALDKSNSDDELLDALRAEISRLQSKLKAAEEGNGLSSTSNRRSVSGSMSAPQRNAASTGYNALDLAAERDWQSKERQYQTEVQRLQRLCKNQSEQLDSQDLTIRELRKTLNQY